MGMPAAGIWRPLVVCAHPRLGTTIGVALSELGIPAAHMASDYPPPGKAADLLAQHQCNICFIDVASDQARGLALIGEMAVGCAVVAINEGKEADLILRCLRRGACEFLPDAGADTLAGLFRRLSPGSTIAAQHRRGKLYTVIPGKPGCGASTLAAHLAVELHIDPQHGVLLVDTDSLTGSISFMLKLKAEFHLDDLLRDWRRLDQDLWARLPARSAGIDVLLAPESPSIRTEIGRGLAGELSSYWRERYDAVVVDCGDVRSAVESGFASAADAVLLVTTNELAALHATKRSLEYLEEAGSGRERLRLVVNRYTPATGLKREDLRAALEVEPFAVLSNDYELIQTALLEGKPAPAGSRFRGNVHALARQLSGPAPPAAKAGGWLRRLGLAHSR